MAIFKRNGEKLEYDQSQDLFLEKLYGSLAGRCLLKVLTQPVITELGGAFMNSSLSKGQINSFIKKNNIFSPPPFLYLINYIYFLKLFTITLIRLNLNIILLKLIITKISLS